MEQAGERCRTPQRRAHILIGSMIPLEMRLVRASPRTIAVGVGVLLEDLVDHERTVFASIDGDLVRRSGDRLAHDLDACLLVAR
jgi:hypothetical protein